MDRYRGAARIVRLATDSHSFAGTANAAALEAALRDVVDGTDDALAPASPTSSS